ncbi:MAG TPA: hypothetical protein DEB10_14140 [Ruminococcaceae bacterium]|nr:hypothetical protein [Oscillospiraceae bacterium]
MSLDLLENNQIWNHESLSPQMLNAIQSSINGGIIIADIDYDFSISFISNECIEMLGYDQNEWTEKFGITPSAFLLAVDRLVVQTTVRNQLEMCGKVHYTYRVYNKAGYISWVLLQGSLLTQADGIERLCGSLTYVCDFKVDSENICPIHKSYYRIPLERLGYILFDYDIENNKIYLSHTIAENYGISSCFDCCSESLVEMGLIHPDFADTCDRAIEKTRNGSSVTYLTIQLFNKYWVEITIANLHQYGFGSSYALGIIRNITSQYKKEKKLLTELEYHKAILSSAIHIYKVNVTKDTLIEGHEGLARRFGMAPSNCFSECLSWISVKWVHPDDAGYLVDGLSQTSLLAAFKNGRKSVTLEFRRAELGKPFMWIKCTINLLRDPGTNDVMGIITIKSIESRKKKEAEMQYLAERDSLCKIYNHGATKSRVTRFLDSEEGQTNQHAMMVLDIDNFKSINDTYGHLYGDNLLTRISECMQDLFRSTDILGRVGGDEFLLFLKNISTPERAIRKAIEINHLSQTLDNAFETNMSVSVSIGIALYPSHGITFEDLYHNADKALYEAKKKGKNTYAMFNDGVKPLHCNIKDCQN